MSRVPVFLLAAVLTVACTDSSPTAPPLDAPTDPLVLSRETGEMARIVADFDATWTAGNFPTYATQFMGDEGWEWVGPTGIIHTDSAAITGFYKTIFTIVFPGTTRNSTIRNLTFLSGTLAVLDVDTRITGFTSLPPTIVPWQPGTVRALEKNILLKRDGEWRIIRHQQTSVAPGVP